MEKLNEKICPKCGSSDYSLIYQGNVNSDKDQYRECGDCSYRCKQEDDKIDSFDFDQGYNLDEVYDQ